jgi:hypothetical protein
MTISATEICFDDDSMWVDLNDGRTLGVLLAWFPKLLEANETQLAAVEISPFGLHWDEIDEDVSIIGLLAGKGDQTLKRPRVA